MKKNTVTRNYILEFKGWAQGRIPTDPDPSFEPRGVSGYTFALPGEPDLDRVIYFQNKKGVVHRSHCPEVGVFVSGGTEFITTGSGGNVEFVSKQAIKKGHPLFNAKIDLKENCIFASENSTIIYNGFGVMNPFILTVEGQNQYYERRFFADPTKPHNKIEDYNITSLKPYKLNTVVMNSVDIIYEAGVLDRTAFRNERKKLLEKDLKKLEAELKKHPTDKKLKIQIAALLKRISELNITTVTDRRTLQAGTQVLINYPLNSKEAKANKKTLTRLPTGL